jgi:hypothetical protein
VFPLLDSAAALGSGSFAPFFEAAIAFCKKLNIKIIEKAKIGENTSPLFFLDETNRVDYF